MSGAWRRLRQALFPSRCIYCGRVVARERVACEDCMVKRPLMEAPLCPFCGRSRALCTCRRRRRAFDVCVSAMRYEGVAKRAVARLKT